MYAGAVRRRVSPWLVTAGIAALVALWLLWAGRAPICECGYVKLWHGQTQSSENSQHLTDWYTPSHVIHGLLFYAALWLAARRLAVGWRMAVATAIEALWEMVENSEAVIDRYRTATIALDYYGDSVVNSLADIAAMLAGFWLARVLPVWASIALILAFEALTVAIIRDGLALNVLMLVWPLDAVRAWQAGG